MTQADHDLALLEQFAVHQDTTAFSEIVRRHSAMVYHTCLRVLHDRAQAEDVAQDTFFKLMRHPEKVSRSVGAWLHRTATRRALDVLRSEGARYRREQAYARRQHERLKNDTWNDLSPRIDEALEKMPEALSTPLVEHFLAGKSQRRLAEEMRVSPATMSRRMRQALAELRRELGKTGGVLGLIPILTALSAKTADAAPTRLTYELGKMAMLSSATTGPASAAGLAGGAKLAAVLALGAALTLAAIALTGAGDPGEATVVPVTPCCGHE